MRMRRKKSKSLFFSLFSSVIAASAYPSIIALPFFGIHERLDITIWPRLQVMFEEPRLGELKWNVNLGFKLHIPLMARTARSSYQRNYQRRHMLVYRRLHCWKFAVVLQVEVEVEVAAGGRKKRFRHSTATYFLSFPAAATVTVCPQSMHRCHSITGEYAGFTSLRIPCCARRHTA